MNREEIKIETIEEWLMNTYGLIGDEDLLSVNNDIISLKTIIQKALDEIPQPKPQSQSAEDDNIEKIMFFLRTVCNAYKLINNNRDATNVLGMLSKDAEKLIGHIAQQSNQKGVTVTDESRTCVHNFSKRLDRIFEMGDPTKVLIIDAFIKNQKQ